MNPTSSDTHHHKPAIDGKRENMFTAYPTYSMSILWNMDAHEATRRAEAFPSGGFDIPLDGDALARSANRAMLTRHEWQTLKAECLDLLRNNHHESDKVDAR